MKKTKILMASLTVATLAIGCGALVACGGKNDPPVGETYDVTFNANGGSYAEGAATVKLTTDENGRLAAAPTETPTYTGYTFVDYNTAQDGSGTKITYGVSGYQFKADTTVYAQWEEDSQEEVAAGLYDADGKLVAELEEGTPGDSAKKQYGAVGVELAPGDVLQIKINGETLTHNAGTLELWTAGDCHGINFDQNAATFTVKPGAERAFDIYAKYYTDGNPCWSITMTDGLSDEALMVEGGAYLVGSGWENGNWVPAVENYIDPVNGLKVNFTTTDGAQFKITDYSESATDSHRGWKYNDAKYYAMAEGKETGYLNLAIGAFNNGGVLATGEYTITIEGEGANIKFIFTPDESIQPNTESKFVDGGFYLAGAGFKTQDTNAEYKLVKEFYLDPDGDGLEIVCTANSNIQLIGCKNDTAEWNYKNNSYFAVAVPAGQEGKADKYISFSNGQGTVNTAGTYIVTIVVTDGAPVVTFTPKDGFAPDETEKVLHYYVKGNMDGSSWASPLDSTRELVVKDTEGVYELEIHLDAGNEFGFRSIPDGSTTETWLGDLSLAAGVTAVTKPGNFKAEQAGTYTFKLNPTTKTLDVTFVADAE